MGKITIVSVNYENVAISIKTVVLLITLLEVIYMSLRNIGYISNDPFKFPKLFSFEDKIRS